MLLCYVAIQSFADAVCRREKTKKRGKEGRVGRRVGGGGRGEGRGGGGKGGGSREYCSDAVVKMIMKLYSSINIDSYIFSINGFLEF